MAPPAAAGALPAALVRRALTLAGALGLAPGGRRLPPVLLALPRLLPLSRRLHQGASRTLPDRSAWRGCVLSPP